MAGIWFGAAAIFRPSVGKAFTLIERTAYVFPEITAGSTEKLMLCTNNLTGDGSVSLLIGLLDVADSTRFLATPVSAPLNPQQGGCSLLLPAVQVTAATGALTTPARTGIPVVFIMGGGANAYSVGGGGAGKGLLSSVQLVEADGSVKLITTASLMDGLLVPAVNLP